MGRLAITPSDLPAIERIPAWNRVLAQTIFDGHLETVGAHPPELSIQVKWLGRATSIDARTSPVLYYHGGNRPNGAERRVFLQTPLDGSATYFEDGAGRYVARCGDLTVGESSQSGGFVCEEPVRVVGLSLPHTAIVPRFATDEDFRRTLADNFAAGLLVDLLAGIARSDLGYAREQTIAHAVGGLLALAFEHARSRPLEDERRSVSRLAAMRDYLRAHYTDADLSPSKVANRFQMSLRHLHRLMERTGRTFGEELLAIRLEAALAALRDPARASRSIADVAFAAGFNDLSYFNRQFRSRYDVTPGEARRQVKTVAPH